MTKKQEFLGQFIATAAGQPILGQPPRHKQLVTEHHAPLGTIRNDARAGNANMALEASNFIGGMGNVQPIDPEPLFPESRYQLPDITSRVTTQIYSCYAGFYALPVSLIA